MSKRLDGLKWQYEHATARDIYDVYERPSRTKVNICKAWRETCYRLGGYDFKIPSANCNVFSVAFKYADPETGQVFIKYVTKYNEYDIPA